MVWSGPSGGAAEVRLTHDITAPCVYWYVNRGLKRGPASADNMQHLWGLVDAGQSADCGQTGVCLLLTL